MSRARRAGLTYVNTQPKTEPTTRGPVTCDLGALAAPDLAVVDALARLRLAAARQGVGLVLRNASGPLRELLAFSGLAAVLPVEDSAEAAAADPADPADPAALHDLRPDAWAGARADTWPEVWPGPPADRVPGPRPAPSPDLPPDAPFTPPSASPPGAPSDLRPDRWPARPPGLPPALRAGLPPRLQPGRQAEQREERVGVEEVGEPGDPAL
ncbi:STAS domain-containing protein [Kitasatospora sp. NBC_00458]|uniref:STAS domain-containing protein n=1 Tax=Kitasatospora sp. NBC_00458 TaxID=2903568 RepID=UPI002E16D104